MSSCEGVGVQGEGASNEIAEALSTLAASGLPDVIIVGRGGGSVEDLWAFNEEPVARAIADCPVPVVSAVGHEVDVTISDLVADVRAPTPSAAAEAVAPDRVVLVEALGTMPMRLGRSLRRAAERRRGAVARGLEGLRRAAERRLAPARQSIDRGSSRLETRVVAISSERRNRLLRLSDTLHALSPIATLGRGYAVPRAADGRVLRRVDDFPEGLQFRLRVEDGSVTARSEGALQEQEDE